MICLVLLLVIISCKKDDSANAKANISASIIGIWELRQMAGAMNPLATNFAPGSGNLLKFTGDKYEVYKNGLLTRRGSYAIVPDSSVETNVCLIYPDGEFTNRIDYKDSVLAFKQFIQITNDTLYIVAGCYTLDAGHSSKYVRQWNE